MRGTMRAGADINAVDSGCLPLVPLTNIPDEE
jgi:hypothetical protein